MGNQMKLRFLSALFQFSAALCCATQALNRCAGRMHTRAWTACTAENLRTLNVRKVRGLRIP